MGELRRCPRPPSLFEGAVRGRVRGSKGDKGGKGGKEKGGGNEGNGRKGRGREK